jgi:6,7-dimethyl-8-ribityllumazine synthase
MPTFFISIMSSANQNLSDHSHTTIPNAANMTFGIVVSEWNHEITGALAKGAYDTLIKHGAIPDHIDKKYVPGSFELTLGAQFYAEFTDVDAIICLGCVIQGETKHFDFICDAVAHGLTNVSLKYKKPVIFGVLTPNNMQQAIDRAGGVHGNKGDEAAITAIKMVALYKSFH